MAVITINGNRFEVPDGVWVSVVNGNVTVDGSGLLCFVIADGNGHTNTYEATPSNLRDLLKDVVNNCDLDDRDEGLRLVGLGSMATQDEIVSYLEQNGPTGRGGRLNFTSLRRAYKPNRDNWD